MAKFTAAFLACTIFLASLPVAAQGCLVIGTWNLEHFSFSAKRGFPELGGNQQLPPRTPQQLDLLAMAIRDQIGAKILVLNEINGRPNQATSAELDDLMGRLGSSWEYAIAKSGGSQRVAIIWDTEAVEEIARLEIFIPEKKVGAGSDKPDIFVRDPLAVYFRLKDGTANRNDILVVALHLASGQHQTANHDAAMTRLRAKLRSLRGHNPILPTQEGDILLAGDLNASPYDNKHEAFFDTFNRGNWKLLSSGSAYPATRINGSQIDYLIVTRQNSQQQGLFGEEITLADATVRDGLAAGELDIHRRDYSDHFPVTTCVAIKDDTD